MNRTQALAIAVIGGLAVTNVAQMVRISGLEGRVRVLEEQAMQVSERQARGWRGAGRTRVVDQPLSGLAQSLNRPPPPTGTSPGEEDIAGMVKQEAQRLETERRERGREVWLANMKGEIADFSAEEGLSPEQTTELQDMTEDFFLAMTDMRHAIYDGSLDAAQAREDMKVFREEHQNRLVEMLGEESARQLQRRVGRGMRGR